MINQLKIVCLRGERSTDDYNPCDREVSSDREDTNPIIININSDIENDLSFKKVINSSIFKAFWQ